MGASNRHLGVAGFNDTDNIHWNWSPARFYETAVKDEGAEIAKGGALVVKTCLLYTSPSPRDRG